MQKENIYNQQNNFNIVSAEFEAIKKWGYGAIPTKQENFDWIKLKGSSSSKVLNIKGIKKTNKKKLFAKKVNIISLNNEILLNR
jgi:predicted transcriptional regulator